MQPAQIRLILDMAAQQLKAGITTGDLPGFSAPKAAAPGK
jgi:hypothetical protein